MMETTSGTFPFQVVLQDPFEFKGEQYLVTVDLFSDFFEVDKLGDQASPNKVTRVRASKKHPG